MVFANAPSVGDEPKPVNICIIIIYKLENLVGSL